jgi:Flp pilus assembly protein TadG
MSNKSPQPLRLVLGPGHQFRPLSKSEKGTEIVEFAVCLPIVALLLIGMMDFGHAFNLKQQLNNAAREGARFATNQNTSDLTQTTPSSITAVRDVIANYLSNAHLKTCGLATAAPSKVGMTWTYTANSNCPGTLTLTIQRGLTTVANGTTLTLTRVTLQYPFGWRFNRIVQLVAPGASFTSPLIISSDAVMQNLT